MDRIVSLYWDNIDPRVVKAQSEVFAHFGFIIDQRERTLVAGAGQKILARIAFGVIECERKLPRAQRTATRTGTR